MDLNQKYEIKDYLNEITKICDDIELSNLWELSEQLSMKQCLKLDLLNFLAFLTACNQSITEDTLSIVSILTEQNITEEKYLKVLAKLDSFSEEYIIHIPLIIKYTVHADKKIASLTGRREKNAVVMRDVFEFVGNTATITMSKYTISLYKKYLMNIDKYIITKYK